VPEEEQGVHTRCVHNMPEDILEPRLGFSMEASTELKLVVEIGSVRDSGIGIRNHRDRQHVWTAVFVYTGHKGPL